MGLAAVAFPEDRSDDAQANGHKTRCCKILLSGREANDSPFQDSVPDNAKSIYKSAGKKPAFAKDRPWSGTYSGEGASRLKMKPTVNNNSATNHTEQ